MNEKLYTIPVNDAFNIDCECPLCVMYQELETSTIDFTLGPSYMEEDIRQITDKEGFCEKHISQMFKKQNSLGIANILKTHLNKRIKDIEALSKQPLNKGGLFKKNTLSPISEYVKQHNDSCFVCNKINATFDRYISTIIYLYKSDSSFKNKFLSSKGFCLKHYEMLYSKAQNELNGKLLDTFLDDLSKLTINNLKRVDADLDWFIDKFDYRYKNKPWKNSKDAIERTITKTNSLTNL